MRIPSPPLSRFDIGFNVHMNRKGMFENVTYQCESNGKSRSAVIRTTSRGCGCSKISNLWVCSATKSLSIYPTILSLGLREMTLSECETEFALVYKIPHSDLFRRYLLTF